MALTPCRVILKKHIDSLMRLFMQARRLSPPRVYVKSETKTSLSLLSEMVQLQKAPSFTREQKKVLDICVDSLTDHIYKLIDLCPFDRVAVSAKTVLGRLASKRDASALTE